MNILFKGISGRMVVPARLQVNFSRRSKSTLAVVEDIEGTSVG